tara:strand:- start:342 stop:689 length:348 start_codon:yes stop_codon:yes gene_type:complete
MRSGGLFIGRMEKPLRCGSWSLDLHKKQARKIKRAKKKKKEKKLVTEQQRRVTNQMNMFDRMPATCSACSEVFPKTREAHMTWKVTVRNKEQQVRLFCPACLEKAKELAENNNEV